jgi:hypothetical protein
MAMGMDNLEPVSYMVDSCYLQPASKEGQGGKEMYYYSWKFFKLWLSFVWRFILWSVLSTLLGVSTIPEVYAPYIGFFATMFATYMALVGIVQLMQDKEAAKPFEPTPYIDVQWEDKDGYER